MTYTHQSRYAVRRQKCQLPFFIWVRGGKSNYNGWTNYFPPRVHWKFPRSWTKMKSAIFFNNVVLANSVCGCFTAASPSAPGDCLPSKDDWLLCSLDQTAAPTVQLQKPKVTNLSRWSTLGVLWQGQPSNWGYHSEPHLGFCLIICLLDTPGSQFALLGSRTR